VDRVKDESDRDIFVRGVLTRPVVLLESDTLYTRYGDWFVWVCMACSAAFVLFAFFRKGVKSGLASGQSKE
jgi:apolipoprotein N-acyltransferase